MYIPVLWYFTQGVGPRVPWGRHVMVMVVTGGTGFCRVPQFESGSPPMCCRTRRLREMLYKDANATIRGGRRRLPSLFVPTVRTALTARIPRACPLVRGQPSAVHLCSSTICSWTPGRFAPATPQSPTHTTPFPRGLRPFRGHPTHKRVTKRCRVQSFASAQRSGGHNARPQRRSAPGGSPARCRRSPARGAIGR